jgi:hypothetical protein
MYNRVCKKHPGFLLAVLSIASLTPALFMLLSIFTPCRPLLVSWFFLPSLSPGLSDFLPSGLSPKSTRCRVQIILPAFTTLL